MLGRLRLACAIALLALVSGAGAASARADAVPILTYHHVAPGHPSGSQAALWVSPDRFHEQLTALARAGYQAVTLGQLVAHWRSGAALPPKPVVITLDDGYADQYRFAMPALWRRHWPAELNLAQRFLDHGTSGITTRQVRVLLARRGWELASHSRTHPDLTKVDPARLRDEVAGSRSFLRHRFGAPVAFFAYPYGRLDPTVEQAVRDAGYLAATTASHGFADATTDPYALPRIAVGPHDTPARLLAKLSPPLLPPAVPLGRLARLPTT